MGFEDVLTLVRSLVGDSVYGCRVLQLTDDLAVADRHDVTRRVAQHDITSVTAESLTSECQLETAHEGALRREDLVNAQDVSNGRVGAVTTTTTTLTTTFNNN